MRQTWETEGETPAGHGWASGGACRQRPGVPRPSPSVPAALGRMSAAAKAAAAAGGEAAGGREGRGGGGQTGSGEGGGRKRSGGRRSRGGGHLLTPPPSPPAGLEGAEQVRATSPHWMGRAGSRTRRERGNPRSPFLRREACPRGREGIPPLGRRPGRRPAPHPLTAPGPAGAHSGPRPALQFTRPALHSPVPWPPPRPGPAGPASSRRCPRPPRSASSALPGPPRS